MSEQSDGGVVERQGRRRSRATLTELVLIVRPPGSPTAIRVFTEAERAEAQAYADRVGADVETVA